MAEQFIQIPWYASWAWLPGGWRLPLWGGALLSLPGIGLNASSPLPTAKLFVAIQLPANGGKKVLKRWLHKQAGEMHWS